MDYGDERLPRRFWDKVYPEPNTGCWLWAGKTAGHGYGFGTFHSGKGRVYLHRAMATLVHGDPTGPETLHSCDTPACVNPDHLRWGTRTDNARDTVRHGNHREANRTHCNRGHPYGGDNTYLRVDSGRACRMCRRGADARRKPRRRVKGVWIVQSEGITT